MATSSQGELGSNDDGNTHGAAALMEQRHQQLVCLTIDGEIQDALRCKHAVMPVHGLKGIEKQGCQTERR